MSSRYQVRLTSGERQFLNAVVRRGQCSVCTLTRAHVLLAADASEADGQVNDVDIARAARTSAATVYRVRMRFAMGGLGRALYGNGRRRLRGLLPQLGS